MRNVQARSLQVSTISGGVVMSDAACDRLEARTVSGRIEFSGALPGQGVYEVNSHSGAVRVALSGDTGFDLVATSFSGSIRSELPLTVRDLSAGPGRGPAGRAVRGAFGDGSAVLRIGTFSGNITVGR